MKSPRERGPWTERRALAHYSYMSLRTGLLAALMLVGATACREDLPQRPAPGSLAQGGSAGVGRRPAAGGASGSAVEGGTGGANGTGGASAPATDAAGPGTTDGLADGSSPTSADATLAPIGDAAADLAVDATSPVDAAPGQALFIIGPATPAGGDITVHERLAARMTVDVMRSVAVNRRALMDRRLVVVSATSAPNALDDLALDDLAVPVLLLEPNLMPVMQMTGSFQNDYGATPANERQLDLVGRGHPLHAGLSGRVTVYDDFSRITWGDPGQQAVRIASPAGRPWQTAIFAYDTGAWMVGQRAPARRVAFFIHSNSVQTLAPAGVSLLDAAIDWLSRPE